jgi:hypothetical protein
MDLTLTQAIKRIYSIQSLIEKYEKQIKELDVNMSLTKQKMKAEMVKYDETKAILIKLLTSESK